MIDILIVHYNTPELTEACVKSINKHTPNCKIHIFDNSDQKPFTAQFDNVEIIDNTKGQIINFDKWLKQYPGRFDKKNPVILNSWGSAKHCISIQKALDILGIPLILMDSDILIIKDISPLYDTKYICCGEKRVQAHFLERVLPFLCFLNTPKMKEYSIKYFDENKMHGLSIRGHHYDTGASFNEELKTKGLKIKNIELQEFCLHLRRGSWRDYNNIPEFLKKYKQISKQVLQCNLRYDIL